MNYFERVELFMSNLLPLSPSSPSGAQPVHGEQYVDEQEILPAIEPTRLLPTRPVVKGENVNQAGVNVRSATLPASLPVTLPASLPLAGLVALSTRGVLVTPGALTPTYTLTHSDLNVEVSSDQETGLTVSIENAQAPVKIKKKRKTPNLRLTERDRKLIEFLTRYKIATYGQAAAYLKIDPSNLRHRIIKLKTADLIKVHSGFTRYNLLGASAAGIRLLNITLPVFTPSLGTLSHTLALTDLGIFFENEGQTVVTEREIRAAWQHGEKSTRIDLAAEWQSAPVTFGHSDPNHGLFVIPPPLGKTTGLRIPDMVLVAELGPDGAPRSIAVEMELTTKEGWRYKEIVSSYMTRGRNQFAGVIYYTPYRDVSTAVGKAIREGGAGSFMTVREYTPPTNVLWN